MTQISIIFAVAVLFFAAERVRPGRDLPNSPGWYVRTLSLNLAQVGIVLVAGISWNTWFKPLSIINISHTLSVPVQGALAWFIGTFLFYWWHRARHEIGFLWRGLHQIHHSAARIEILTSFYKHPLEMMANSMLISMLLFSVLGTAPEASLWFNLFAAVGEMFYHANLKTPHWVGYVMQRPEHHSLHHEFGVHNYNFGDITWWDRLFGTFKDTHTFAARCGFREGSEQRLGDMLLFRDVY